MIRESFLTCIAEVLAERVAIKAHTLFVLPYNMTLCINLTEGRKTVNNVQTEKNFGSVLLVRITARL